MRESPLKSPDYTNTPFDLSGKTALITGASGGLGEQFAATLASAGATLILSARDSKNPKLLALQEKLSGSVKVTCVGMDVGDSASVSHAFTQISEQGFTADILLNNAGIAKPSSAINTDESLWQSVLDTNLSGAWYVAREFAKRLVSIKHNGAIVNVTSILGQRVSGGVMSYAVTKAGLEQMTSALALEWARYGIRVNALAPGYIVTDMNRDYLESSQSEDLISNVPQRRVGEPADLDGALLLLASAGDSFMTGSTVVVDGGHLNSSL